MVDSTSLSLKIDLMLPYLIAPPVLLAYIFPSTGTPADSVHNRCPHFLNQVQVSGPPCVQEQMNHFKSSMAASRTRT